MNQEDASQLSRAVNLAQTGHKEAAHNSFATLSAKYPANTLALLWLAFTSSAIGEARAAISRAAQLEPDNPDVRQAQSWLKAEMAKVALTPLAPGLQFSPINLNEPPPPLSQSALQPTYSGYPLTFEASEPARDFNLRFNQAVRLAQAGNQTQAYQDLKQLARETGAQDSNLLLWLAFTSPDLEEAATAISMAETQSPGNPNISGAKGWLHQAKLKAANGSFTPETVASGLKAGANPLDFQALPNQAPVGYKPPAPISEAVSGPKFQTGLDSPFNSLAPDLQSVAIPPGPTIDRRRGVNTRTMLVIASGVVAVLLIAWAVFFFTSTVSSTNQNQNQTVFEKMGLATYSELDTLELPQNIKDQLPTFYSSTDLSKSGLKFSQMDTYKIKTTSSADDFTRFYKSELNKGGWNVRSISIPTNNSQSVMIAVKGNYYIYLALVNSSSPLPELKAQLAPNQVVAMVILLEKTQ
jgi:hypothetical protein